MKSIVNDCSAVKRIFAGFDNRQFHYSLIQQSVYATSFFFLLLFSNMPVNVLSAFVCLLLLLLNRTKKMPWPTLVVLASQISLFSLSAILEKMQVYYFQGFFSPFMLVFKQVRQINIWNEPLFIVMPICLCLVTFPQKKSLSVYFLFCSFLYQVHFLPMIGILLLLRCRTLTIILVSLWLVENYICSVGILLVPPQMQWIDLILLMFAIPISLVVFDVPHKILNLRRNYEKCV